MNQEIDIENKCIQKKRGRKPFPPEVLEQKKKEQYERYKEKYRTVYAPLRDKTVKSICECGSEVLASNLARHRKSLIHIKKIESSAN